MNFADSDTEKRFSKEQFSDKDLQEFRFNGSIATKGAELGYYAIDDSGEIGFVETRAYTTEQKEYAQDGAIKQQINNLRNQI